MNLPQPPPGVVPNFNDPENTQSTIIATLAVTLGAATFFTAVRVYTKAFVLNSIALEDYTACVAWAGFVAFTILSAVKLQYGFGLHEWDVPISSAVEFFKLTYAAELLYGPLIFIVKLTILLQVQHIFAISSKLRFYLVQFMIWSNACWYFAYTFIVAFACTPTAKSWDSELPGHCINSNQLVIIATIPSVISDLVILTLPTFWVWKVQMARRRKLEVSLIFSMGFLATLFSILRLAFGLRYGTNPDQTWFLAKSHNLWSSGEIAAGIMCGCLTTFPRFLAHISSKTSAYLSACKARSAQHPDTSWRRTHQFRSTRTSMARGDGDVDDCLQLNNRSNDINDSLEFNNHSSNFNIQDSFADSPSFGNGSIAVPESAFSTTS